MRNDIITIKSYKIKSKVEATYLTKLQRLICKLFRITPEVKYFFTINIITETNHPVRVGDNVLMQDGTHWRATKTEGRWMELMNIVLLTSLNIRNGDVVIFYSNSYSESTGSPTSKY